MQKKFIPIVVVVLILIGVGGIFAFTKLRGQQTETPQEQTKKKITLPVNVIPVVERPFVSLKPLADGRNIEISIESLNKEATEAEYEIEYQAGTLLQGAAGLITFDGFPAVEKIFLGSCSAGGACTYHEDIKGGNLLLTFEGGNEAYAVKSDWKYIDNAAKETELSSKDAFFQLSSPELAKSRYFIVFNTYGVPAGYEGTPISNPYSLGSSTKLSGEGELSIRATEEGGTAILGWDGEEWQEFETTVDGKTLTATVDLLPLYIAVKK